jgi:hypothetical protein
VGILKGQQSLPLYGEPASRKLLTHLPRLGSPYGSPPVKRDVRLFSETLAEKQVRADESGNLTAAGAVAGSV